MSSLLDEEVPRVAPLSMAMIEELGRCFLDQLAPEALVEPCPLDICKLIDRTLPRFGIHVSPASTMELGNREAATTFHDDSGDIEILLSEEVWGNIAVAPPHSYYARSTVCHEIGHATMHIPALRRRVQHDEQVTLARMKRSDLKAYEDPEWQAFAFAGSIMMPSVTLKQLRARQRLTTSLLSEVYEVSQPMAASYMKRLKWLHS